VLTLVSVAAGIEQLSGTARARRKLSAEIAIWKDLAGEPEAAQMWELVQRSLARLRRLEEPSAVLVRRWNSLGFVSSLASIGLAGLAIHQRGLRPWSVVVIASSSTVVATQVWSLTRQRRRR
jgi:hypothetical protein